MLFITHKKKDFSNLVLYFFSNVEQLLLKSINSESYQKEYDDFVLVYADAVKTTLLPSELLILHTMFESFEPVQFDDIVENLKTISPQEHVIINNLITIIKIVLTTGATSATLEKSFSLARQVKTWLWSSIKQKRFNALAILHSNKEIVEKLSLVATGNDFVDNLPIRRNNLGIFSESDSR